MKRPNSKHYQNSFGGWTGAISYAEKQDKYVDHLESKNKELINKNKDLKITIEGLQMEVNDLQAVEDWEKIAEVFLRKNHP